MKPANWVRLACVDCDAAMDGITPEQLEGCRAEGWADVAGEMLQDSDALRHFWNEGEMVTYKLLTANPQLAAKLRDASPTGGAEQVANRASDHRVALSELSPGQRREA